MIELISIYSRKQRHTRCVADEHMQEHKVCTYLHKVVENFQAFRVLALRNLCQGTKLCSSERYVLIAQNDLKLLPAYAVRRRPVVVVFLQQLHSTASHCLSKRSLVEFGRI